MARVLRCDTCEAVSDLASGNKLPPGWLQLSVERSGASFLNLHACSDGCAIRGLAGLLHDEAKPVDERDRCMFAGCDEPALPLREVCSLHAIGEHPCERDGCGRPGHLTVDVHGLREYLCPEHFAGARAAHEIGG